MSRQDKTKIDNNRTSVDFFRNEISQVLPEYFAEEYPNIEKLFSAYYEYMDSADNPSGQIKRLYSSRDATQVPEKLLQYLEDELLLGQAYFGGFLNKREAIKFSNTLYRSKGTKYSIEQFFRGFYGIDPQIIYPKNNIFKVGPAIDYDQDSINKAGQQIKEAASVIGPESRKFITDDKLYQVMSVLIRIGLPLQEWVEAYKLFVHPGGVYLGSELLLELVNAVGLTIIQDEIGDPITEQLALGLSADFDMQAFTDVTLLLRDSDVGIRRQSFGQAFSDIGEITLNQVDADRSIIRVLGPNSTLFDDSASQSDLVLTMDQDSDGIIVTKATFDQGRYNTVFDSDNVADSAHYPFRHV